MKKSVYRGLGWVVAAAVLNGVGTVRAGEEAATPATATADLVGLSAYVWRGQVLNDEAVLQPSFTLGKSGFTINTWGNMNLTDAVTEDAPDFSELDLTLSYAKTVGNVGLGAGFIEYTFPNTAVAGTRELYASLALPNLVVVPTLAVYYDFDEADGVYGNFSLGYSRSLCNKTTLGLFASLGMATADYNMFYFGVDEDALNDVNVGASVSFAVTKSLTIVPAVQYTALPDGDIEDGAATLYKDTDGVIGSVKASYTF